MGHTLAFANQAAKTEVERSREHCRIYILLLSFRFFDSDVIRRFELPLILSLPSVETRIIYVVAENCEWQSVLPQNQFATIPADGSLFSSGGKKKVEANLDALVKEVRRALHDPEAATPIPRGSEKSPPKVIENQPQEGPSGSVVGEKGKAFEAGGDGDLDSLRELDQFGRSETIEEILIRAGRIGSRTRTVVHPVTPSTLFFAMVEIGGLSRSHTAQFLFKWFASKPEQRRAYEGVLAQYQRETGDLNVGSGQMTANVLPVFQRASEIAIRTMGATRVYAHHLLAALLAGRPDNWGAGVQKRLFNGGIDIPMLQNDFLAFLRNDPTNDIGAWTIILGHVPENEGSQKDSDWITQDVFDRFSEDALVVLSRSDQIAVQIMHRKKPIARYAGRVSSGGRDHS